MFSEGDKVEQERLAETLEDAGYTTYLPQRDGIEVGKVMALVKHPNASPELILEATKKVRPWVFALDMYQLLERCKSLVYNIDGRTPDEGGAVEAASAFTSGKPVVVFKTTPISLIDGTDNPMVQGLSFKWEQAEDDTQLPKVLGEAIANAPSYSYNPPPEIAELLRVGKAVWKALAKVRDMPLADEAELKEWLDIINAEVEATGAGAAALVTRTRPARVEIGIFTDVPIEA
jgi:hypothetical protein